MMGLPLEEEQSLRQRVGAPPDSSRPSPWKSTCLWEEGSQALTWREA